MPVTGGSNEQDPGDERSHLAMELPEIKINHIETKSVMTRSTIRRSIKPEKKIRRIV